MYQNSRGRYRKSKRRAGNRLRWGNIWPLIVIISLLTVPPANALDVLRDRLRAEQKVSMAWPCNESETLALTSDTSSKRYSFRSNAEEMQVFSSAGGTVTEVDCTTIVISHGNGLETVYDGCTDIYVTPLQKVWKGELIGSIRAIEENQPELHFQILKEQESVDIGDYF